MFDLKNYLAVRRDGWPVKQYSVDCFKEHGFRAMADNELAGISWAENVGPRAAKMHMTLKDKYSEYGIGTELLHLLMDDLKISGFETIYYEIPEEYYAYQIYHDLGLKLYDQDEEMIRFVWEK